MKSVWVALVVSFVAIMSCADATLSACSTASVAHDLGFDVAVAVST
jgi:hypothetical protein